MCAVPLNSTNTGTILDKYAVDDLNMTNDSVHLICLDSNESLINTAVSAPLKALINPSSFSQKYLL